jgi:hypothetical protein
MIPEFLCKRLTIRRVLDQNKVRSQRGLYRNRPFSEFRKSPSAPLTIHEIDAAVGDLPDLNNGERSGIRSGRRIDAEKSRISLNGQLGVGSGRA